MKIIVFVGFIVLALLSLRGKRWAYVTYVVLGLLYFPASVGFRIHPHPCELMPSMALAVYSLGNWPHIVLFVLFFLMTSAQFNMSRWSGFAWAGVACIIMGLLVEFAEGVSGKGHCRMRDLVPDSAGIVIGAAIVLLWKKIRNPTGLDRVESN